MSTGPVSGTRGMATRIREPQTPPDDAASLPDSARPKRRRGRLGRMPVPRGARRRSRRRWPPRAARQLVAIVLPPSTIDGSSLPPFIVKIVISASLRSPFSSKAIGPVAPLKLDLLQLGQVLGRIGRVGLLHRLDHQVRGVVGERRVDDLDPWLYFALCASRNFLLAAFGGIAGLRADQALGAASPASLCISSVHAPSPKRTPP